LSGPSRTVVHPAIAGLGPVAPSGAVEAPDRSGHKPQAYRDPRKIAKFLPDPVVGHFEPEVFLFVMTQRSTVVQYLTAHAWPIRPVPGWPRPSSETSPIGTQDLSSRGWPGWSAGGRTPARRDSNAEFGMAIMKVNRDHT